MYKEPADIMEFIVISLFVVFCLFIVWVFFLSDKEIKGALYLNKEGKSDFVCDGVLYKHIGYVTFPMCGRKLNKQPPAMAKGNKDESNKETCNN